MHCDFNQFVNTIAYPLISRKILVYIQNKKISTGLCLIKYILNLTIEFYMNHISLKKKHLYPNFLMIDGVVITMTEI